MESLLFIITGHGDGDCGAVGNGFQEAERVRALARRVKHFGGDNVLLCDMDRNYFKDKLINSLGISKDYKIIELHLDSSTSASAKGGHVIIKKGLTPDKHDSALADMISEMFPGRADYIVGKNNLANANRAANRGYNYRLLECCFISNADDIAKFNGNMDGLAKRILGCFDINVTDTAEKTKNQICTGAKGLRVTTSSLSIRKTPDGEKTGQSYEKNDIVYPYESSVAGGTVWYHTDKGWISAKYVEGWVKESNGRWWYVMEGYTYTRNGWQLIENTWYCFDADGWMLESEWTTHKGHDYYLTSSGAMATDAYVKSATKNLYYWVNSDGVYEPQWDTPTPDLSKYRLVV